MLFVVAAGIAPGAQDDPLEPLWRQQSDRPGRSITVPDLAGRPRTVTYVDIDGRAVIEGDIVVGTAAEASSGRLRMPGVLPDGAASPAPRHPGGPRGRCRRPDASAATSDRDALWPGGVVPYVLSPALPPEARAAVTAAIGDFTERTCVRFVPRAGQDGFLDIFPGGGCYSYVGRRRTGPQDVSVGPGCERKGIVIHELMHALGFYHEHSRSDRDTAVTVHLENVLDGYAAQFQKLRPPQNRLFGAFDYGSVMLYGRAFFSRNGKDTLVPRVSVPIGQRVGFSPADVAAVRALYACPPAAPRSGSKGGEAKPQDRDRHHQDHQRVRHPAEVAPVQMGADRSHEVEDDAGRGRDAERRQPEPGQQPDGTGDLAGGQEREHAERHADAGEAVDHHLVPGQLRVPRAEQRQGQHDREGDEGDGQRGSRAATAGHP
ncbi:hypothetical protein Sru01_22700 [Sphaerisporangium rufum]|uniref:Peptidase M12A domain-containing protein n=1 Tax=Sphaerisporangium rufum TaxID=1381558 RepID=A0A919R1H3_9ACTN|nr:M12 family metallopeptidase [Sphaerisporangium rufum]GII77288.1 hypothetical protein Sru01_22700 [Sphaerisporangium rufum]